MVIFGVCFIVLTHNLDCEIDLQEIFRISTGDPFSRWSREYGVHDEFTLLAFVKLIVDTVTKQGCHSVGRGVIVFYCYIEVALTVNCE